MVSIVAATPVSTLNFSVALPAAVSTMLATLTQLDVRNVYRYDKRLSIDARIGLASEDAVHRGKLNPGHLDVGVDVVGARCVSRDLYVVVVAPHEPGLVDIESLLGAVSGDAVGKADG